MVPPDKPLISIVVPVYNEEANVRPLHEALCRALDTLRDRYDFEFVFTDNCSKDLTFDLLTEMSREEPRLRVFRFSRNFGYQRSILSGYRLARGAAVVQIDCDLQDPPDLIRDFIAKWEAGYAVVYGIRSKRPEGILLRTARKLFYRGVDAMSETHLPHDAGDFRLVDRSVIDIIARINDTSPYLRGMIANVGFPQTGVKYRREKRLRGQSKFGLRDLARLALDGITNHSVVPLRLASLTGVLIMLASFGAALFFVVNFYSHGDTWPPGFATLITTILFLSGMNALFLGVLGEYIGRIFLQVKPQPTAIVEQAEENGKPVTAEEIDRVNKMIGGK
jgi:dolichol-phosphate mannosyltransferase